MTKLMFAAAHYAALAVFVASCWGFGRAVLVRFGAPARSDVWLEAAMAITTGTGIFICVFQAFGIAGLFTPTVVVVTAKAYQVVCGTGQATDDPTQILPVTKAALATVATEKPRAGAVQKSSRVKAQ